MAVAAVAALHSYRAGQLALIMYGEPTRYLFVVRTGAMELLHGAEMIEVLEPGECFGHPSLVSGLAPTFSVRARPRRHSGASRTAACALLGRRPRSRRTARIAAAAR